MFVCVWGERDCFKDLAHVMLKAWKLSTPEYVDLADCRHRECQYCSFQCEGSQPAEFLPAWGRSIFCSSRTFNWLDEAHPVMDGSLLHSKCTDINVNLIQKHSNRNILLSRIIFDHIGGHYGPVGLTHEINHHRWCSPNPPPSQNIRMWLRLGRGPTEEALSSDEVLVG